MSREQYSPARVFEVVRPVLGDLITEIRRSLEFYRATELIDIGQERAAFLHVEDLIRPDDFDEYLAGGRKLARTNEEAVVASVASYVDDDDEAYATMYSLGIFRTSALVQLVQGMLQRLLQALVPVLELVTVLLNGFF